MEIPLSPPKPPPIAIYRRFFFHLEIKAYASIFISYYTPYYYLLSSGANDVLLPYANTKVLELDGERKTIQTEIAEINAKTVSPEQLERISNYLDDWQNVDFNDRRQVVDGLISRISVTDENVEIEWKI